MTNRLTINNKPYNPNSLMSTHSIQKHEQKISNPNSSITKNPKWLQCNYYFFSQIIKKKTRNVKRGVRFPKIQDGDPTSARREAWQGTEMFSRPCTIEYSLE